MGLVYTESCCTPSVHGVHWHLINLPVYPPVWSAYHLPVSLSTPCLFIHLSFPCVCLCLCIGFFFCPLVHAEGVETRLPWSFQEKCNALCSEKSGHAIELMHIDDIILFTMTWQIYFILTGCANIPDFSLFNFPCIKMSSLIVSTKYPRYLMDNFHNSHRISVCVWRGGGGCKSVSQICEDPMRWQWQNNIYNLNTSKHLKASEHHHLTNTFIDAQQLQKNKMSATNVQPQCGKEGGSH